MPHDHSSSVFNQECYGNNPVMKHNFDDSTMTGLPTAESDDRDRFAFPDEHSLCERCGYPLRGIDSHQQCPECGDQVLESSPQSRPGLAWQSRMGLRSLLKTAWVLTTTPSVAFRRLRVDHPACLRSNNWPDRVFLLILTAGISLGWGTMWWVANLEHPWIWGASVVIGIITLTYIEILGVAYFSRKHGWRVPMRLCERVGCYSSVGWVPAGVLFAGVCILDQYGVLARWWPVSWGHWNTHARWLVLIAIWGMSILGFEVLVWLGVRKVKYANGTPPY